MPVLPSHAGIMPVTGKNLLITGFIVKFRVEPSPSKSNYERSNVDPTTPPSDSVNEPHNVESFETVTSYSFTQTNGRYLFKCYAC